MYRGESRKILRIQGFDYSKPGYYFITIRCHNGDHLFGKIENREMILNEAGEIAKSCWVAIPDHYPHVQLDEFVIMPNHIHGLLKISQDGKPDSEIVKHDFGSVIPKSIASIVRGFKIGVTKWFREKGNDESIWHRSYHCVVVDSVVGNIRNYIYMNPANFKENRKEIR